MAPFGAIMYAAFRRRKPLQPGFARGQQANRPYGRRKRASPLPASRDFPRKRWQNKAPRALVFISGSRYSTGCCAPAFAGERWCRRHQRGESGRRSLITVMLFLMMNPKAFNINQPDGGGRLSAPFCMPPFGGSPLWWLMPPPFPQLSWWDYGC